MPSLTATIAFAAAAATSAALVEVVRRWCIARGLYDPVTPRSSHTRPTPRLGGVGIVLVSLAGAMYAMTRGDTVRIAALMAAFLLVAIVGFRDDLQPLTARVRFLVQIVAAATVIAGCGYFHSITIPGLGVFALGWMGVVVTFIWIVGVTNAFNFMDGIDGIAGGQAVVAAIGWVVISLRIGDSTIFWLAGFVGAAVLGFLVHNWWPARIFMGDVASASLGLFFAALPLLAPAHSSALAVPAALMLWPFLFDTTFTLVRRMLRGENIVQAHRSHLYQRLVIAGHSHAVVSSLYIALAAAGVWLAVIVIERVS